MDKPIIEASTGPAPAELVIEDIIVGDGAEAQAGGVVEVHYVGVEYESNQATLLRPLFACRRSLVRAAFTACFSFWKLLVRVTVGTGWQTQPV